MYRIRQAVSVGSLILCGCVGSASGQGAMVSQHTVPEGLSDSAAAVYLAARHAIDQERSLPDPARIVVDVTSTGSMGMRPDPIGRASSAAAFGLAQALGAQEGRLEGLVTCREEMPDINDLMSGRLGRCELPVDVGLVVQVGNLRGEGQQAYVWVTLWKTMRDENGDAKYLSMTRREVMLTRDGATGWAAPKITSIGSGHF